MGCLLSRNFSVLVKQLLFNSCASDNTLIKRCYTIYDLQLSKLVSVADCDRVEAIKPIGQCHLITQMPQTTNNTDGDVA